MRLILYNYNFRNMSKITLFILAFLTVGVINAQSLEDELGFIYVKADYLLETDRYEESIQEFTKIISEDPAFKDALYKRATAKFAIAAFLGTKKDILQSFEVKGVTPETLILYGKALENLNEEEAATNTQKTASMLLGNSSNSNRSKRNDTNSGGHDNDSGSSKEKSPTEVLKEEADKIDEQVGSILDQILGRENGTSESDGEVDNSESDGDMTKIIKKDDEVVAEKKEEGPDMSENEIFIDEDLTLIIKDGLGGRKVLNQPNILILNETSGYISVDVCVNRNGKVLEAVYNQRNSTLNTQSLVSLAVRKSKEFWFEKSNKEELCGTIVFKISGRS